jgi:hypothetical protein
MSWHRGIVRSPISRVTKTRSDVSCPKGHAMYSAGRPRSEATAVYFRTLEDATRFLVAFPTLELADDTVPAPGG